MASETVTNADGNAAYLHVVPKLPEATRLRLVALVQQRQAVDAKIQDIVTTTLEVLGLEGQWTADIATGELKRAAAPTVLPNRAQRRAQGKK